MNTVPYFWRNGGNAMDGREARGSAIIRGQLMVIDSSLALDRVDQLFDPPEPRLVTVARARVWRWEFRSRKTHLHKLVCTSYLL